MSNTPIKKCQSLTEIREQIDGLDQQIMQLIAQREAYVRQAAQFKKNADDVMIRERVEQVVNNVIQHAQTYHADPVLAERVYRSLVAASINIELQQYHLNQSGK